MYNGNWLYPTCFKCQTGVFLLNKLYYYSCPDGFFADAATSFCKDCSYKCNKCLNTGCYECMDDNFLDQ